MQSKPAVLIVEDEPGIGLPFVREIAELHGGRITLRNAAPKNTISFTNTDKALQFLVTDEPFDGADNEIPDQLNPNQPTMMLTVTDSSYNLICYNRRLNSVLATATTMGY